MEWRALAVLAGIGLAACSSMATMAGLTVSSSAFGEGGAIPSQYTCDGADTSPPLAWQGAPEGTRSFAVLVTDPDARGFVHWVLTDIPADVSELPEGQGDAIGVPGANDFSRDGWGGPCPPSGQHRYEFRVYAVSETLGLGEGASADQLRAALQGKVLAEGVLTGVYARR
ncbi:MAG TPA: YbhB/YbcL family Raf kinase inhibitor-like protein [candidate division Zixibacteria bacterium]|nr:YbhB/YbcL family Raf kinase inhibitor-like protein [candidate division Zixibacteria bacterium]